MELKLFWDLSIYKKEIFSGQIFDFVIDFSSVYKDIKDSSKNKATLLIHEDVILHFATLSEVDGRFPGKFTSGLKSFVANLLENSAKSEGGTQCFSGPLALNGFYSIPFKNVINNQRVRLGMSQIA